MNGFLQEYGLNIVAVIIVLAFIVFASIFGDTVTGGIKDITNDFFAKSGVTTDVNGGNDGGVGEDCDGTNHIDSNGDNACDGCNAHVLSGTWTFNNVLTYLEGGFTEAVNFKTGEATFNTMHYVSNYQPRLELTISSFMYGEEGDADSIWVWEDANKWQLYSESCKVVDFGDDPQEVSSVFYNWFTANATKTGTGSTAGHPSPAPQ